MLESPSYKPTILVIGQEIADRVSPMLQAEAFIVTTSTPDEARKLLKSIVPNLIVSPRELDTIVPNLIYKRNPNISKLVNLIKGKLASVI